MQRTSTIDFMTYVIMLGLASSLFGSLFELKWLQAIGPVLVIVGFAGISMVERKK
ncbi:hypothetical protein [Deinococcus roseus]|uniref:Uncharacterized protein n=1 Tax=Deinococcus roseus TaxID=392414 RepID=A0ABQ2DAT0_9DEIO|nr:hypothetical protein [Deinococcus roseus]GGJ51669.1 hypothetical protein GCM10008938_42080 [Deinococcus roseus]